MALVVYPEVLPRHIHDDIMKALESEAGQQAKEFSDYLFRYTLVDGSNGLHTLHKEGMIKKVPTNQVIVTPDAKSTIRLDELNSILAKMALGEEAVKELADLDANRGMNGKRKAPETRPLGEVRTPAQSRSTPVETQTNININDVLTDEQIASQRLAQAQRLERDARAMLAEAARLQKESESFSAPTTTIKNVATKPKKAKVKEA